MLSKEEEHFFHKKKKKRLTIWWITSVSQFLATQQPGISETVYHYSLSRIFSGGSVVKNPAANEKDAGDAGLIPGSEWSPQVRNTSPLKHSCLENSIERGACGAAVHRVGHDWACMHTHIPTGRRVAIWSLLNMAVEHGGLRFATNRPVIIYLWYSVCLCQIQQ